MALHKKKHILIGSGGFVLVSTMAFALPFIFPYKYAAPINRSMVDGPTLEVLEDEILLHMETPDPLRAIYMTSCVASTKSLRDNLVRLIEETEINSVVIDIKDSTGRVSFPTELSGNRRGCGVPDLGDFIKELHEKEIYVIGRISVFQDPYYSERHPELAVQSIEGGVWKDYKGLSFVDVGAREYWDFIVDLSKEAYELGFDEVNYDYIRYPSDGNMRLAYYSLTVGTSTKSEMLESFFSYLDESLEDTGLVTSADLFGMTTIERSDMGIGQILEETLPYFDYVSPMVYPSHYPKGWYGFENPAEHPYEVVSISMKSALEREAEQRVSLGVSTSTPSKLRPWIQDFDLGALYDVAKVKAQIEAVSDLGLDSYMVWNASNRYTKEAHLSE